MSAGHSAEPKWVKSQTPRFGLVSQLDEDDTRKWAVEFDQFVDALHQLLNVSDLALPPLTVVLFKDPRSFAPYRNQTESGQANVSGFFANMGTWSTIGLAGRRSTVETRQVVYHEAAHWVMSASEVGLPMWFEEGLAEVFSAFEVRDGKGRWGMALQSHVDYLRAVGLQPLEDFFRVSQDEALHSNRGYYPQAWLFVHYMMFGMGGENRSKLAEFLRQLSQSDRDTAFTTAFGKSYEEMTDDLRAYLRRGSYSMATPEVRNGGEQMQIAPATALNVEASLARLAVAGSNLELAQRHANALIAAAPNAAAGYEVLAVAALKADDATALNAALDKAIELRSSDANLYSTKAIRLMNEQLRENSPLDDMIPADTARAAADLLNRSIALRALHRIAYEGLASALLNVDGVTAEDDAALAVGRRVFPTDGFVLVGQAAAQHHRGDPMAAMQSLRQAGTEPFTLPGRYRTALSGLHDQWFGDWLGTQMQSLTRAGRFGEAHTLLDAQLADAAITGRARAFAERTAASLHEFERLYTAIDAARSGLLEEARSLVTELLDDSSITSFGRREAERLLQQLEK
jgi:hypothetical protein